MSNTHQLVYSYKKLILGATGFYLVIGGLIYLVVSIIRNPESYLQLLLIWVSNTFVSPNTVFTTSTIWLMVFLTLLLLSNLPLMVSRQTKVRQISIPFRDDGSDLIDMITHMEEPENNTFKERVQQPLASGVIKSSKGMLMVADGKVMFVNKDFCQQTGYVPAEVIGKDFVELLPSHELPKYAMLIRSAAKTGKPAINSIEIYSSNNKRFLLNIASNNNSGNNPIDLCLFHLKEAEVSELRELEANETFIRSMEATHSSIWMWDEYGMLYINPNCRKLIKVPMGLLFKDPRFMLKVFRKETRKEIAGHLMRYIDTLHFNEEVCVIDKNNKSRWYQVGIYPCRDNSGHITHHIGIANEITEQKHHIQEIETTCEQAIAANYNKTAFLANMSHEIRSPLNGILGFSELLVDPELSLSDRDRYHDIIKNNGNALLTILTDIIDISKLESGKMKITEKAFQPSELVKELQVQFARDPIVVKKELKLNWFINEENEHSTLLSDPYRIRQVMVNLITNAIKFTNGGEIEIASEWWGDRAVFWIKDSGIGIPEDSLPFIFDRYRQLAKNESSNTNGFGLGLAICKALVELLGGNIWVESQNGQGSVFYFTIPNKTPNLTHMNNMNSSETAFPYDWKGRTILIAEDIDFSFLYIEAVLRRTGAKVLWAQNGREAIEMVKVNPSIDIALMDIHMPIMNGYDATREIIKIRPELPIIAQTAFVLPDDVKACYAAGCAGYLAKPIRREQLLNTLTEYFEKLDQKAEMQAGNMPVYRSKIS